jgi:UDP-glucose 4-epimerase
MLEVVPLAFAHIWGKSDRVGRYSVLEVIRAFEQASGCAVPYRIVARRPGDIAQCYADASLAESLLGWRAEHGIEAMCRDAWRWQEWAAAHKL